MTLQSSALQLGEPRPNSVNLKLHLAFKKRVLISVFSYIFVNFISLIVGVSGGQTKYVSTFM